MPKNENALAGRIKLRPAVESDEPFLRRLYFDRREDLSGLSLPEPQLEQLLSIQYLAQKQQYEADFPMAEHYVILFDDKPVGRYMVEKQSDHIAGIDMALLPGERGLGIGSTVIQQALDEAAATGRPYLLQVEWNNRASGLYRRLGFVEAGRTASHIAMEWRPQTNF
jgi:GNAT superfamily N-acetyltransferase